MPLFDAKKVPSISILSLTTVFFLASFGALFWLIAGKNIPPHPDSYGKVLFFIIGTSITCTFAAGYWLTMRGAKNPLPTVLLRLGVIVASLLATIFFYQALMNHPSVLGPKPIVSQEIHLLILLLIFIYPLEVTAGYLKSIKQEKEKISDALGYFWR